MREKNEATFLKEIKFLKISLINNHFELFGLKIFLNSLYSLLFFHKKGFSDSEYVSNANDRDEQFTNDDHDVLPFGAWNRMELE